MVWVSTIRVLGFFGSTFPKTFRAIPGLKSLVSFESMVNCFTFPCGTPSTALRSGAAAERRGGGEARRRGGAAAGRRGGGEARRRGGAAAVGGGRGGGARGREAAAGGPRGVDG